MGETNEQKQYTVQETYEILEDLGITTSLQVVQRWVREEVIESIPFEGKKLVNGKVKGKKKVGSRILETTLNKWIKEWVEENGLTSAMRYKQKLEDAEKQLRKLKRLESKVKRLENDNKKLQAQIEELTKEQQKDTEVSPVV